MKRDQRGHMRFVGGIIYCPRMQRRYSLGLQHHYAEGFVCPGCNVEIPRRDIPQRR